MDINLNTKYKLRKDQGTLKSTSIVTAVKPSINKGFYMVTDSKGALHEVSKDNLQKIDIKKFLVYWHVPSLRHTSDFTTIEAKDFEDARRKARNELDFHYISHIYRQSSNNKAKATVKDPRPFLCAPYHLDTMRDGEELYEILLKNKLCDDSTTSLFFRNIYDLFGKLASDSGRVRDLLMVNTASLAILFDGFESFRKSPNKVESTERTIPEIESALSEATRRHMEAMRVLQDNAGRNFEMGLPSSGLQFFTRSAQPFTGDAIISSNNTQIVIEERREADSPESPTISLRDMPEEDANGDFREYRDDDLDTNW